MTDLLHLSALLPTAFGACCTVGGRRWGRSGAAGAGGSGVSRVGGVGLEGMAAVVMLLAMADVALGLALLAPILWVGVLIGVALALPLADRAANGRPGAGAAHPAVFHSSLGLIVMAGLVALMSAAPAASGGSHHGSGGMLGTLVLGGAVAYVAYSARRAAILGRRRPLPRDLVGCLEAASMAASVGLMAAALAV